MLGNYTSILRLQYFSLSTISFSVVSVTHGQSWSTSKMILLLTYGPKVSNSLMLHHSAYGTHLASSHHIDILSSQYHQKKGEYSIIKIFFKILHIYSWETQRERQRHRQMEKQAPYREPNVEQTFLILMTLTALSSGQVFVGCPWTGICLIFFS